MRKNQKWKLEESGTTFVPNGIELWHSKENQNTQSRSSGIQPKPDTAVVARLQTKQVAEADEESLD